MCKFYAMGNCTRSSNCTFAHTRAELKQTPDFRCTKLCPELVSTGRCGRGEACDFAHDRRELRSRYGPAVRSTRSEDQGLADASGSLGSNADDDSDLPGLSFTRRSTEDGVDWPGADLSRFGTLSSDQGSVHTDAGSQSADRPSEVAAPEEQPERQGDKLDGSLSSTSPADVTKHAELLRLARAHGLAVTVSHTFLEFGAHRPPSSASHRRGQSADGRF
uniref:C3H1-type domain-containing protein n=1 Tax=Alexandrium catenella TaxID=2925 RepID=A0A7S1RNJ8_ALECA